MAFINGEYLNDVLAPQILRELQDDKSDFFAAIPNAPDNSVTEEGLRLHLLRETQEADINPGADYDDGDVVSLNVNKMLIPWDNISTKPMQVTKDEIKASVFDRQTEIRSQSNRVLLRKYKDYVLYNLTPADDSDAKLPVLRTTGAADGARKRLTVDDLITYQKMLRAINLDQESEDWYIRLSNEHITDLLIDTKSNQTFRDLYHKTSAGEMMNVYGFKFFRGNHSILFDNTGAKKALGAAAIATDRNASIFWTPSMVIKSIGMVTAHLSPISQDTRSNPPKEEFRLTGYIQAQLKHEIGTGAIVSGIV